MKRLPNHIQFHPTWLPIYRKQIWTFLLTILNSSREFGARHTHRVYAPALMPAVVGGKTLAGHIEQGDLGIEFAARDVRHKQWTGLAKQEDVQAALELLEDLDWVHEERTAIPGRTRVRYLVNSKIRQKGGV